MQIEPKIIAFKARQPLKSAEGTRTLSRLRSGIGRHHPSTTHKYAASPLLFGKRTGYPRQDVVVLLLTNNKEATGMEEMEEFAFYLEQKYRYDGIVEARILTAEQAKEKGYRDYYVRSCDGYKLYVDGFESEDAARFHVSQLIDCVLIE